MLLDWWLDPFWLIECNVLLIVHTCHLTGLEASHLKILLFLVWCDDFVGLSDLKLIRNSALAVALCFDVVNNVLNFLLIDIHWLVTR